VGDAAALVVEDSVKLMRAVAESVDMTLPESRCDAVTVLDILEEIDANDALEVTEDATETDA